MNQMKVSINTDDLIVNETCEPLLYPNTAEKMFAKIFLDKKVVSPVYVDQVAIVLRRDIVKDARYQLYESLPWHIQECNDMILAAAKFSRTNSKEITRLEKFWTFEHPLGVVVSKVEFPGVLLCHPDGRYGHKMCNANVLAILE